MVTAAVEAGTPGAADTPPEEQRGPYTWSIGHSHALGGLKHPAEPLHVESGLYSNSEGEMEVSREVGRELPEKLREGRLVENRLSHGVCRPRK
jgi:hypothetical protein